MPYPLFHINVQLVIGTTQLFDLDSPHHHHNPHTAGVTSARVDLAELARHTWYCELRDSDATAREEGIAHFLPSGGVVLPTSSSAASHSSAFASASSTSSLLATTNAAALLAPGAARIAGLVSAASAGGGTGAGGLQKSRAPKKQSSKRARSGALSATAAAIRDSGAVSSGILLGGGGGGGGAAGGGSSSSSSGHVLRFRLPPLTYYRRCETMESQSADDEAGSLQEHKGDDDGRDEEAASVGGGNNRPLDKQVFEKSLRALLASMTDSPSSSNSNSIEIGQKREGEVGEEETHPKKKKGRDQLAIADSGTAVQPTGIGALPTAPLTAGGTQPLQGVDGSHSGGSGAAMFGSVPHGVMGTELFASSVFAAGAGVGGDSDAQATLHHHLRGGNMMGLQSLNSGANTNTSGGGGEKEDATGTATATPEGDAMHSMLHMYRSVVVTAPFRGDSGGDSAASTDSDPLHHTGGTATATSTGAVTGHNSNGGIGAGEESFVNSSGGSVDWSLFATNLYALPPTLQNPLPPMHTEEQGRHRTEATSGGPTTGDSPLPLLGGGGGGPLPLPMLSRFGTGVSGEGANSGSTYGGDVREEVHLPRSRSLPLVSVRCPPATCVLSAAGGITIIGGAIHEALEPIATAIRRYVARALVHRCPWAVTLSSSSSATSSSSIPAYASASPFSATSPMTGGARGGVVSGNSMTPTATTLVDLLRASSPRDLPPPRTIAAPLPSLPYPLSTGHHPPSRTIGTAAPAPAPITVAEVMAAAGARAWRAQEVRALRRRVEVCLNQKEQQPKQEPPQPRPSPVGPLLPMARQSLPAGSGPTATVDPCDVRRHRLAALTGFLELAPLPTPSAPTAAGSLRDLVAGSGPNRPKGAYVDAHTVPLRQVAAELSRGLSASDQRWPPPPLMAAQGPLSKYHAPSPLAAPPAQTVETSNIMAHLEWTPVAVAAWLVRVRQTPLARVLSSPSTELPKRPRLSVGEFEACVARLRLLQPPSSSSPSAVPSGPAGALLTALRAAGGQTTILWDTPDQCRFRCAFRPGALCCRSTASTPPHHHDHHPPTFAAAAQAQEAAEVLLMRRSATIRIVAARSQAMVEWIANALLPMCFGILQ